MSNEENPEQLLERAGFLRRTGRTAEAIQAYERLLAVDPDRPDSWFNLGYLQRQAGRFEPALEAYRRALDQGVSRPEEVHLNRAAILADHLQRGDEAQAELDAALAINPDYAPAWLNLGNLHEDRGRREEAAAAYRRALAADPENLLAVARLADVSAIEGPEDSRLLALRGALARPGLADADAADLGFALGRALDSVGAYDDAFAAYAAANRASRAALGPDFPGYRPAAQEQLVARIAAAFSKPAPPAPDLPGQAPIFICGMFRSGSTLTERILARHSRVTAGGELDLVNALIREGLTPYPDAAAAASGARFRQLREEYLGRLNAILPDADRVTDKRPDNFLYIGLIKAMFPDAKIVHTVREPLDNALSIYFLHLDPRFAYAFDPRDIAHRDDTGAADGALEAALPRRHTGFRL